MRIGMRIWKWLAVPLLVLTCGMVSLGFAPSTMKATLIVENARVYTVNAKRPWADAVAIGGDRILAVGSREAIDAFRNENTRVIDAHGRLVLPGFTDSHFHLIEGFRGVTQEDLNGTASIAEGQKRV